MPVIYATATRLWLRSTIQHRAKKPKLYGESLHEYNIYFEKMALWKHNRPKFKRSLNMARRMSA